MALSTTEELVDLYVDTFIDKSSLEVPYKLMEILTESLAEFEAVIADIQDLTDINLATGANLDLHGDKWQVFRQGKTDAQMRDFIFDQIAIFFSGSTLSDFITVLASLDAPIGSRIFENAPPESAEVNVLINGATTTIFERIKRSLAIIKGAGIEIDAQNVADTGDKILLEDADSSNENFLTYEDGDLILQD